MPVQPVVPPAQPPQPSVQKVQPSPDLIKKQTSVPQELIDSYLNQSKHPVSVLMEYAASLHITAKLDEVPLADECQMGKFSFVCRVEGKTYPQVSSLLDVFCN